MIRGSFLSRVAALALAFIALMVVLMLAVPPLRSAYDRAASRLEQQMQQLARIEGLAAREAALARSIASLRGASNNAELLLPAGSDGAAVALLQDRLQALLAENNAELASVEALPAADQGGYRRVGLRLQFTTDVTGLRAILHGLETARPMLVTEGLSVRSRSARAVGVANPLDVRLDAVGLKPGQGTGPGGA